MHLFGLIYSSKITFEYCIQLSGNIYLTLFNFMCLSNCYKMQFHSELSKKYDKNQFNRGWSPVMQPAHSFHTIKLFFTDMGSIGVHNNGRKSNRSLHQLSGMKWDCMSFSWSIHPLITRHEPILCRDMWFIVVLVFLHWIHIEWSKMVCNHFDSISQSI